MKKILIPLVILIISIVVAWFMIFSKPEPQKRESVAIVPMVRAITVEKTSLEMKTRALGTVQASQDLDLRPRVSGTVLKISDNLQPGALVKKDDILVELDPSDYQLDVRRKQSAYETAKANLEIEMGQQRVAKAELEQLQRTLPDIDIKSDMNLALREPHLDQAKAAIESAKADLDEAKLNLERTKIRAPFDAIVTSREISVGSQVTTSEILANLSGTDEYWVEATLALDRIHELNLVSGAKVDIFTSSGTNRIGTLKNISGSLDTESRMGEVIISVENPLAQGEAEAPLYLGDQVTVQINSGEIDNLIAIPREAFRSGDKAWIIKNNKLNIVPVKVFWRDADNIYISSGLNSGDVVVSSDLTTAVEGMELKVVGANANSNAKQKVQQNEGKQ